jgi:short-subunit dehydrogenase
VEQLRGRNALVTGAAGGLGGYIANALASEGANLVLSDLPEAPLEERVEDLRRGGVQVESVSADIGDPEQAGSLVARAEEALGSLDILVNNAGLEFGGPFVERSPEEIVALTNVNLIGVMLTTRAALPGMLERRRGHIVNVASMAGKAPFPFLAPYCGSKHGVIGFTGALRAEYVNEPVGFSAICPGFVGKVGMYGRLEQAVGKPPTGPLSIVPPEAVGAAVVKAIRDERAEVIVNRVGARPLILLSALAPGLAAKLGRGGRVRDFAERFAAAKESSPRTAGEQRVADRARD